ncbi:MAG: lamin tail domain-containing protein, partial [Candidatus Nitrosomaritimum yanchengensis]
MIRTISILLSALLLVAFVIPVYAQSSIADHIVINEIDINPPGDDSASPTEWVELYNPTNSDVDIGGWKIASTTVLKQTLTIPSGTIIKSGQFITYSYKTVWFTDTNEIVQLRDNNGFIVDSTPLMTDIKNDFTSWQRIYDGYDLDSPDDWKFVTSNAGS